MSRALCRTDGFAGFVAVMPPPATNTRSALSTAATAVAGTRSVRSRGRTNLPARSCAVEKTTGSGTVAEAPYPPISSTMPEERVATTAYALRPMTCLHRRTAHGRWRARTGPPAPRVADEAKSATTPLNDAKHTTLSRHRARNKPSDVPVRFLEAAIWTTD